MSYKKLKKKMLAGMLVTVMACSSVATDGFGTAVHEMVKAKADLENEKQEVVAEETEVDGASQYGLCKNIQDGTILHCFDWKYSQIKEELPNIAAAGFTSVQTSPAQKGDGQVWYWLYQPQTFSVQPNALGTKAELQALCDEAENYGIKVIVDVVANHTRAIGDDGLGADCYHNNGDAWYTDRTGITMGRIGMPDLNSEHPTVQNKVKGYIEELKGMGVDGIRWDEAKHIALPSENCQFWPVVTSVGLYNYGEILVGPLYSGGEGLMKEYTDYMSVTDGKYGQEIREAFEERSVPSSVGNWSERGISKNKLVYWGESHYTYSSDGEYGEATQLMDQNIIDRAYAIVAGQGKATSLYFSRPYSTDKQSIMAGQKGSTHFTSKEVAAVNHLHNACVGEKDCYVNGGSAAAVCRETGAVIVKGSGSGDVSIKNDGGITAPGTYIDEVSGSTWTVTADTISGTVDSSGIAVIYKSSVTPSPTPTEKPTATPTKKPTATPTKKPTATPTQKPMATPTAAPTEKPIATPVPKYTVTFNGMGGNVSTSAKQVTQGEKYGTLPTPERTGYSFVAWCVNTTGGAEITSDSYVNLSSNQTLYALWIPKQYTVTLDPQGGTVSYDTTTVSYEKAYSTLPTPVKENENFVGWYTEDNQLVTSGTYCKIAEDHTLHAVWETAYRATSLEQLTYQFGNHSAAFSYPSEYKIPLERYQYIYGDTILAKSLYTSRGKWGGNCFGMSSTSTMFHTESIADAKYNDFNAAASGLVDLSVSNISQNLQLSLTQMIESMQIAQYDTEVQKSINNNYNNLNDLCEKVEASQKSNGQPVLICLYGPEGGHAVVGYKITGSKLYIYDPNYPEKARSIELTQNAQGEYVSWYYYLNDDYEWKSGKEGCGISYIPFDVYKQVWEQRSTNRYASTNMLTMSIENAAIYDVEGNEVAKIEDGDLHTQNNEIYQVQTMELDENSDQEVAIYLPTDVYVIENTDQQEKEFSADMTNVNQGVSVTTQASKVTFAVDDQERINSVICNAGEGQSYSLSLQSTFEDDKKSVEISGTGNSMGEVGISQSLGNVDLKNCDMANVSINGVKIDSYVISSRCSQGGTIVYQGNASALSGNCFVVKGDSVTYIMTPEDGYVLSNVLVDGVSVGAVPIYCFENVTEAHDIVAVFVKFDASAITVDSVVAQAHTGQKITPAITVRMDDIVLKENIDYSVVYSNNKNVGTAKATIIGIGSYKGLEKTVNFAITANKGEFYTVAGVKYQVTDAKKKEVMFVAPVSKKKTSVTIPKTVKIGSATYKVTKIAEKAFNGCSKLKKITVKSTYLTSVGSNAFKGIYKKAVIKVPAAKLTKYKKLMKNKGQKGTVKIKK